MATPEQPGRTGLAQMNGLHCSPRQTLARPAGWDAEHANALRSVVHTYSRFAPLYDKLFGAVLEPGRRAMTQVASALAPESVLEVGVGTGLTLPGYPEATRVVGIDVSQEMLHHAQLRAASLPGRDIALYLMSAEQMQFADESFDCVTLPYVLSVTPQPALLLKEVRRVCRKGGTILVLNHFSGSGLWRPLEWAARPLADRIGFRSELSFEEHIATDDWRIEAVRSVNLLGLSRLVTLRNESAHPLEKQNASHS
jgi:phosphatidylethanolamine/phosphatidyl-N-methylethanolamine N-methyltransferase